MNGTFDRRKGERRERPAEAELRYAIEPPAPAQLERIRSSLCRRFRLNMLMIDLVHDPTLHTGFVIRIGSHEFDFSEAGRETQLREHLASVNSDSTADLITALRGEISDFTLRATIEEIGTVTWVGDGIAIVEGVEGAFYGEILVFEDGTRGMVQDVSEKEVGCILFGGEQGVSAGAKATRTRKQAGIPVGKQFLGRVVDALGDPIDMIGKIEAEGYYPVEQKAPGIMDRRSVCQPMETGILSIDTMFPIGRGQRELIIGDRQTGKTSIAIDTIINQKGKNVLCIYVAIGQKVSTVARLAHTLREAGAMEYTTIVSSTAADPAPLQYIAPYAGCALAEFFMRQGKDVLIVYDDLSKHAVAYRSMSLLLGRPPGREAYPGDVFYLHSRLLERAAKLNDANGGGSITALPIIETQAGDVSAYIPTNVISITDGQIFLESDLFFEGMRPAVNVGLSVSRVGSAAQTKAMKKAAGSIRIDLAQYREMAVFTQFSSDLDEATKKQLAHGKALMELLKQPLYHPLSQAQQVITLVCANKGYFDDFPTGRIKAEQNRLLEEFARDHSDILMQLSGGAKLDDVLAHQILEAADRIKAAGAEDGES
ncbi:MAG: F0F1 ATP synthase subunit alpha [Lachnospiraceae bacterium]|nr:F0F1 ATP synthase subunit alpha [Lachnospiraceae bacterium]